MRTLEKVLEKEFNPNRRLHGWARPGMEMDREDFIDLATVSKQVPGKTPEQVKISLPTHAHGDLVRGLSHGRYARR